MAEVSILVKETQKSDRYVLGLIVGSSVSLGLAALYLSRLRWLKAKPQRSFSKLLTDNSDTPFKHSQMQSTLTPELQSQLLTQPGSVQKAILKHPYGAQIFELMNPTVIPTQLKRASRLPRPVKLSSCLVINTVRQLRHVCVALSKEQRIGLDVEHHHIHSYYGFTCLLQLSTGDVDYVIDVVALHDHMGMLKNVFSNENILKVLHGGDNDVVWLQKDFGLYLVNVFDTTKAATVIGRLKQFSLAHLLERYCKVQTDKKYQLADWRQRPLSNAMMIYARTDAHYLCYIADKLTEELRSIDYTRKNLIDGVMSEDSVMLEAIRKSQMVSLNLFEKVDHQVTALNAVKGIVKAFESRDKKRAIMSKRKARQSGSFKEKGGSCSDNEGSVSQGEGVQSSQNLTYSNNQVFGDFIEKELQHHFPWTRRGGEAFIDCLYALCVWRDKVARYKDENVQFIMPNQLLMKLADMRAFADVHECLKVIKTFCFHWKSKGREIDDTCLHWNVSKICKLLEQASQGDLRLPKDGDVQIDINCENSSNGDKKKKVCSVYDQKQKMIEKFSTKNPVYDNCKMLAKNGEILCHCDKKKLNWYVEKGLADYVSDEPPTIQLRFQHKVTDPMQDHTYYVVSKNNVCVVCGESGHYLRYRVVPSCYRRNFPVELKSHRSHDVVLLCVDCHESAHRSTDDLKNRIAEEYGIPLFPPKKGNLSQNSNGFHPQQIRKTAISLQKHSQVMPESRRKQMEHIIKIYFGRDPSQEEEGLKEGDLEAALMAGLGPRKKYQFKKQLAAAGKKFSLNDEDCDNILKTKPFAREEEVEGGHFWHGAEVVKKIMSEQGELGLMDLVVRFRKSFVDTLNPMYLPHNWTIEHNAKRQFGDHSVFNPGHQELFEQKAKQEVEQLEIGQNSQQDQQNDSCLDESSDNQFKDGASEESQFNVQLNDITTQTAEKRSSNDSQFVDQSVQSLNFNF